MRDLLAFTAEHVSNLTGLSIRQLYYWDKTGFFLPKYADEKRDHPFSRIYSFRDVVSLRALATLRNRFHVPLQGLRKANEWLRAHYECPWSSLTLYVRGHEVFFLDPDTESRRSVLHPEQMAMPIEMEEVAQQIRQEADRLRERRAEQIGQIERRRFVVHNAPVVSGTRIPAAAIWNFHRSGYSVEQIIREYPSLTPQDVQAAINYEQRKIRQAS